MFQATRRRLALWYTVVTAVLLLLFASGVYLYVRSTLIERIDDTLNHVVEVVERSLLTDPAHSLEASFQNNVEVEDDHIDLEWFTPTGELQWSTLSEPLDIPLRPNRTGETVHLANHTDLLLRQVTARVQIGRQVLGYLRVSHPWFEVTKPIQQLVFDLSLGTGLMVLSVALCGWFLSGKAMEPVRESYQRLKQFTADASHELRSPIALIQTNVQVALTEPEPELQLHRQQLKVIERLTQRLGRLVDDLLFLARQDSGIIQFCFSPCPLDALLMEVVEEQRLAAAEKHLNLSLNLVEPTSFETTSEQIDSWFTLQGDWNQLVRLFTNLISNAVQYTPADGRVHVELQRIALGKGQHLNSNFQEEAIFRDTPSRRLLLTAGLQVKVSDTGIGIPESALPHLFDRFYRVDPARTHSTTTPIMPTPTGSGLGLAIAAAITLNHQGQIQVDSTLNQGTTFTVTLPVETSS
ncbi:MAG: HAMP domain-containing histidine kinase [Chroococcidiopsidaceae cyanobacterium CP_BM_ER_R8_30]|nr:HAMP domain-containing histidine kinase [Chroococcidiopsidaceae cyanobacterium CP_BM_ER_R8_30]